MNRKEEGKTGINCWRNWRGLKEMKGEEDMKEAILDRKEVGAG